MADSREAYIISGFTKTALGQGINCYVSPASKFKTVSIRVIIQEPLNDSTVTANALLPRVLKRGTSSYQTTRALTARLEELYGARLLGDVAKAGDRQLLVFGLDMVAGKYVGEGGRLLKEGVSLLNEVLTAPATSGEGFIKSHVDQEKDNLSRQIRSLINDKTQYSMIRCIQEMFSGEPFGLHQLGTDESASRIGDGEVYQRYKDVARSAPIDIFIVGDVLPEEIIPLARSTFDFAGDGRTAVPSSPAQPRDGAPREVFEPQAVNQGKLTMGYRTGITLKDDLVHGLMVFDGILGAFSHSKLFINVREKEGLAYYAQSALDNSKGIMLVIAGIDPGKRDKAVDVIQSQVEQVKRGEFTDLDLETTRKSLLHRMRSSEDSVSAKTSIFYEYALAGVPRTLEERIKLLEAVDRDKVIEAGSRVELDTIYFLGPEGRASR